MLLNIDIYEEWIYLWYWIKDTYRAKDIWDSDEVKLENYIKRVR